MVMENGRGRGGGGGVVTEGCYKLNSLVSRVVKLIQPDGKALA